jgi:hypothetical protein
MPAQLQSYAKPIPLFLSIWTVYQIKDVKKKLW